MKLLQDLLVLRLVLPAHCSYVVMETGERLLFRAGCPPAVFPTRPCTTAARQQREIYRAESEEADSNRMLL